NGSGTGPTRHARWNRRRGDGPPLRLICAACRVRVGLWTRRPSGQGRALILGIACDDVAATGRRRVVALALAVAVDGVAAELLRTGVVLGLDVPVDVGSGDGGGAAAVELDVPADPAVDERDGGVPLALDVAIDGDLVGHEGAPSLDLEVATDDSP